MEDPRLALRARDLLRRRRCALGRSPALASESPLDGGGCLAEREQLRLRLRLLGSDLAKVFLEHCLGTTGGMDASISSFSRKRRAKSSTPPPASERASCRSVLNSFSFTNNVDDEVAGAEFSLSLSLPPVSLARELAVVRLCRLLKLSSFAFSARRSSYLMSLRRSRWGMGSDQRSGH